MPRILNRPEQARRVKAKVQIQIFKGALDLFKLDTGRYPTTAEGLETLVANPGIRGWRDGGYLEETKVPLDPWATPYVYLAPGAQSKNYDLESYGKDGEDGGEGDDADIESWNMDAE